jgi:hypothetical protein
MWLQGQLELVRATVQAKDDSLSTLRLQNFMLHQLATGSLAAPLRALPPGGQEDPDREPVLGGFVTLKPIETSVADINVPMMLRALKRWRGQRDDDDSSCGE